MKSKVAFLTFFLIIGLSFNSTGQILKPVKWSWNVEKISENEYDIVFKADIDGKWSLYSQHIKEGGPVPTSFTFDKGDNYTLIGDAIESDNVEKTHDKVFDMPIKKFHHYATFTQKIKVSDKSKKITGYINFMTCDDTRCLPPSDIDFSFDFTQIDKTLKKTIPVDTETEKKVKKSEIKNTSNLPKKNSISSTADGSVKKINKNNKVASNTQAEISDEMASHGGFRNNTDIEVEKESENKNIIPVKWNIELNKIGEDEFILKYTATMKKGWDIYSIYTEDNGPVPTSINYEKDNGVKFLGKIIEKGHLKSGLDKMFGVNVKKFLSDKPYEATQKIKVTDKTKLLKGYITFQACDDTRCILLEEDFGFDFKNEKVLSKNDLASLNSSDVSAISSTDITTVTKYSFDKEYINEDCGGSDIPKEKKKISSWWLIFLLGFGGGLLAFLTPCVFPMVPLTVSYFTKKSDTRAKGIRNALYYGLSIIAIYVIMGLAVTALFGADALNQLSTNAWFNLIFAVLFIVFGISFFGYFEITLPSSWANKSDAMANKGGLLGIFFMAFTLALVSFSCTGPIIGTLLVETATGGGPTILGGIPTGPLFGMLGFSTALALPFALFAMFPAWLNSMPKSGSWMNTIKVTLGFIEVALALKFISIADLTMGWNILPYELFVGAWVLIALAMAAYYFGILRFPLDPPNQKVSVFRKVLGTLMIAFALYFATGFRISERSETFITPNMLSGLAPPAGHSWIYPKECPLNLNCFHDFDDGVEYAKEVNKPILLDFTGFGCVNCRRMEDNIWSQDKVFKIINDEYILISLYVDDREKLEEPYFSNFSNKKMRTVGNKWADFQAIHFDRNSQPYYVLIGPNGKVLNKPVAYTPDVDAYKAFLECGLSTFKDGK